MKIKQGHLNKKISCEEMIDEFANREARKAKFKV
jgi:hypothetical protein